MADFPNHPLSGKPDTNTHPTSSEFDEFPSTESERHRRAFRPDPAFHRGTRLAVEVSAGGDGASVSSEATLTDVLYELRALRAALMVAGVAADIGDGVERAV